MSEVINTILNHIPYKHHTTPKQWISFNCVIPGCNDKRNRGGIKITNDVISYSCFNCGFKCSWRVGYTISKNMKYFMECLNINDSTITKLCFLALKSTPIETQYIKELKPKFFTSELPKNSILIKDIKNDPPPEVINILHYINNRGLYLDDYPFYWANYNGFRNRLIIPFYYNNNIVGYTARKITDNNPPRYLSDQQVGYVFNIDNQRDCRNFVIVCEGPIDAISIDGCAILGSTIRSQQDMLLKELHKEIIYVPDRNEKGITTIDQAINYNWSVSMPDWPKGIIDINDAVTKLGRLTTLWMIIQAKQTSSFKIQVRKKLWL